MMRRWLRTAVVAGLLVAAGCTLQDLRRALEGHADVGYEQARRNQQEACERLPAAPAREACEARLPPPSFEEYERMRRSLPPRQPAGREDEQDEVPGPSV